MGNAISVDFSIEDASFEEAIINFIQSETFIGTVGREAFENQERVAREKRRRISRRRCENLWDSNWGILLSQPNIRNPDSYEGKQFRRRFRLDYRSFEDVVVRVCEEKNIFESKNKSRIDIRIHQVS